MTSPFSHAVACPRLTRATLGGVFGENTTCSPASRVIRATGVSAFVSSINDGVGETTTWPSIRVTRGLGPNRSTLKDVPVAITLWPPAMTETVLSMSWGPEKHHW